MPALENPNRRQFLRAFVPAGFKALMLPLIYNGLYCHCQHMRIDAVDSSLPFRNGRYEIDWI